MTTAVTIIPEGIQMMEGERVDWWTATKLLDQCCEAHPFCSFTHFKDRCRELFEVRCHCDPRFGGWGWVQKVYRDTQPRYKTDMQKYAGTVPTLHLKTVVSAFRQKEYY